MKDKASDSTPAPASKRSHGSWLFLLATIGLYGLVFLIDPDYAAGSFGHFVDMVKNILPILVLVFFLLWGFELIGGIKEKLGQLSGRGSGLKGWLLAIGGGILSHGPIYPWYPLLQHLREQGTRPALLAAFLYARSIKLPWLPLMVHYFGLSYTVLLTLAITLFSIPHGWLVEWLTTRRAPE